MTMKTLAALAGFALPLAALAGNDVCCDKHFPEHYPAPVTIVKHDHDDALYALSGAAIGWWLHRRYVRHHPAPIAAPVCSDVKEVERRATAACGK